MRICLVCRMVNETGGIGRYVFELCRYFASRGHEVHVFTNIYSGPAVENVTVRHVPMIKAEFLGKRNYFAAAKIFQIWSFSIMSKIFLCGKQFDIVHVQGDSLARADIRTFHSCHKAWLKGAAKNAHGIFQKLLKSSFNPLHFVVLVIEKYNSGRCKKLITVSKCVADEVHINYSVPCNKIVSILNGVDIEKFSVSNKSKYSAVIRQKYGIAPDETVLLFVGHEFVRKGLEVIINALQELKMPKLTLLIVGSDKDELFKNKTEKLGLTSKVIFAGRTNEVEKFYAAADIFVLPAAYEPFGLVVTEAMASGLPVIISGNAGAAEVINNGDNGFLLDPQDMKTGLINCIKKLTGDSVLKRSVSIRARETIEKYSWRNMGENTEKVYNEVINAMNRPSPLSSPSRGEDVRIG